MVRTLYLFILICSMPIAASSSTKLPLTVPPAPFSQKAEITKINTSTPSIKGDLITYGNKDLQVSPDGAVKLFCNGRLVAKSFFLFNTMHKWFPSSSSLIKDKKSSYNPETKTFVYSGKYPLTKANDRYGAFTRSVTLLKDGNIKFHYSWDTPRKDDDVKALALALHLAESNELTEIGVDGKVYTPVAERIFYKSKPEKLDMFLNDSSWNFSIQPKSTCYVTGTYKEHDEKQEKVRINIAPGEKAKELTYIMSLGNVYEEKEAEHKYAGIDFYALERLEMPDYRSNNNLVQNSSFEQGFRYLWPSFLYLGSYPYAEKWDNAFQIDNVVSKFGQHSLKIKTWSSDKPRKNSNLHSGYITSLPIPIPPGKYTLSFYAKGNRPEKQLVSVFMPQVYWQESNQLALPGAEKLKMGKKVQSDWTRYSCVVDIDKSMPARIAFGACSETADGYVWVDGVLLEKGDKLSKYEEPIVEGIFTTSDKANFLNTGQSIDAELTILAKPETKGDAKVMVKNFFGEELFDQTLTFCCNSIGEATVRLPFNDIFGPGIYVVKATYKLADGQSTFDYYRFSIMDKLSGNERLRKIFGANYGRQGHSHRFKEILKRNSQVGLAANTHCEYRLKHVLDEYENNNIAVTDSWMASRTPINGKDRGSFKIKDGFFYGDTLIGGFLENNPSRELTEEYLKEFKKAVKECAAANPQIRRWSLFGEAFCWFPEMCALDSPDERYNKYIRLQIAFYEAIKSFDPSLEVTNGDPPNMSQHSGIKLLERQLAATKGKIKYDYIGIHPYRTSPDNGDLDADTKALLEMLKRHGYEDTPVFWPEGMHYGPYNIPQWNAKSSAWTIASGSWYYGAFSYDMGWNEKVSAAWRARSWLIALKYQDRITTAVSAHSFNNYIIDYNLAPFATQKISHTLTRLLGDAVFKKDIRFAPNTRCYVFEDKDKCPIVAVWGTHPMLDNGSIDSFIAEVALQGNKQEIFDIMEQTRDGGSGQKITFPISPFPLFFKGKPGQTDEFIEAFENASLISGNGVVSTLTVTGRPVSESDVELVINNQLNKTFSGKIVVGEFNNNMELKPFSTTNILTNLPISLSKDAVVKEQINISIIQNPNDNKFNLNVDFSAFLCGRNQTNIKIDGKLDDWINVPEIALPNRYKRTSKLEQNISDEDLSAWYKTAWDETGLYLCVKVKDNVFFSKIDKTKNPSERWNNDSLQIYIDSLADGIVKGVTCYDENDYDYAIFPDEDAKGASTFLYNSPDPQLTLGPGAPLDRSFAPHIPSALTLTDDGYIYEVKFPATYLRPAVLKKGTRLGFGLFVNDRDDDANGVQSSLTNTPQGTQCYKRPNLWPIMLLTD